MDGRAASALAQSWALADAAKGKRRGPTELTVYLRRNGAYTRAARSTAIAAYYAALRGRAA